MTVYPLCGDDRGAGDARLIAQGPVFDPMTRRLPEQAGITPGVRVPDTGSGAGNVARIVGQPAAAAGPGRLVPGNHGKGQCGAPHGPGRVQPVR